MPPRAALLRSIHSASPHGGSTSREPRMSACRASDVARVWCGSLLPLRNTSVGRARFAHVVVGEAGDRRGRVGAVHEHPAFERLDELLRVEVEEALAVARDCARAPRPIRGARRPLPSRPATRRGSTRRSRRSRASAARRPRPRSTSIASFDATSGWRGRGEQRDPRAARAADDRRRARGRAPAASPASLSACISDSDAPVKQTSEAPVFGRSQISTCWPCAASASASSRTPGASLVKRPPGRDRPTAGPSPMIS